MNWNQRFLSLMLFLAFCTFGKAVANPVTPLTIGGYFSGTLVPGSLITFTGALSRDRDNCSGGYTPFWRWQFNFQGTFLPDLNPGGAYPTWTYSQPGTYVVAVQYVDDDYQSGNIYTFQITISGLKRFYYLKDHLGSIRATVQAGRTMLNEDFSGTLAQWMTVLGTGYSIQGGELVNSSDGPDNLLVNSSGQTITEGIITVDVKSISSPDDPDLSIVVKYLDNDTYYLIHPRGSEITIYERLGGIYYIKAVGSISPIVLGTTYRLQVTLHQGNLGVAWNSVPVVNWTDPSPLPAGKVGFRQCTNRNVHWDNITVTTEGPGEIVSSDDYDPWGMVWEGRSTNLGSADSRYKFAGKERDVETGYDYFGARFYDARIGRFLSVDPHARSYPALTPYLMAGDNPLAFADPSGMDSVSQLKPAPPPKQKAVASPLVYVPTPLLPDLTKLGARLGARLGELANPLGMLFFFSTTFSGDNPPADEPNQDAPKPEENASPQDKPQYPVPEFEGSQPKGSDWIPPKTPNANWTRPAPSEEYVRDNPDHGPPIGPHKDWRDPSGKMWRIFPDGRVTPKSPGKTW